MSDDEEYHYSDVDDDFRVEPTSSNNAFTDQIPLIPTDYTNIYEAMQNFSAVFEARYGAGHPPFYPDSLCRAMSEAFEAPGRSIIDRRPLAIYLHYDGCVAANIFAQQVLCSETVSSLMKCQFVVWAWDMTQNENRQKLYEWTRSMPDLTSEIRDIHRKEYPLLVLLTKDRSTIQVNAIIRGQDDVQMTVDKLMTALDSYDQIKSRDQADERSRMEREQIRQEQVEEYERALATDRARQRELAAQREREREEEESRQQAAEEKRKRQEALTASLPSEPAADEPDTSAVRVRFPSGRMETRRFRNGEPLKTLVTYVESLGYDMDTHRIWTADVPKKNLASFDASKSFAELKWPRREQITVEEK